MIEYNFRPVFYNFMLKIFNTDPTETCYGKFWISLNWILYDEMSMNLRSIRVGIING